jgi:hypothetical protein
MTFDENGADREPPEIGRLFYYEFHAKTQSSRKDAMKNLCVFLCAFA